MMDGLTADDTPSPRDGGRPLVSVGMPVFNGEAFIREAIDSVLNQEGVDFEIVISDNASTDGTRSICEGYAGRYARVRYHRNAENLGLSGNFKKAAELARGTYFTWLAHDDSLTSSRYLAELAGFLERNPDVVLCGSAMRVSDAENPGKAIDRTLDAILPDRDWRDARLEFFRWPQPETHWVLYGLYRRDQLLQVPLEGRRHRGMPVAVDVEYPILASLCRHGRIVALPHVLRNSRSVANSAACREIDRFSPADHFLLAFKMKLQLLAIALRMRLPLSDKIGLLRVALGNFARAQFGQRPRFTEQLKHLRREVATLHGVCEDRLRVIDRLSDELERQRALVQALEQKLRQASAAVPHAASLARADPG